MPDVVSIDDNFFIKNAILCWLHHYPNHKWTAIYEELAERDSYVPVRKQSLSRSTDRRPRGRSKPSSTTTES